MITATRTSRIVTLVTAAMTAVSIVCCGSDVSSSVVELLKFPSIGSSCAERKVSLGITPSNNYVMSEVYPPIFLTWGNNTYKQYYRV